MFFNLISVVILYLLYSSTSEALGYFQNFLTNTLFDDRICYGADQIAVSLGHEWTSQCIFLCVRDTSCLSVFYNTDTGSCARCYVSYTNVETLAESLGSVYYVLETKEYGDRCVDGDKCRGTNQVCWTDTCICEIGYSYHSVNGTCVERCETYGTSFQRYPNRRINGNNIDSESGVTLEECKQACIDCQSHTCLSLEYDQDRMKCNLSKESALTVPGDVTEIDYFDFYTRNCD